MAFIHMECPNCGGGMKLVNNQFVCGYCHTTAFNIIDAKIDEDVTVMTPEEFESRIEKNKRQFLVKIDDNLKVFDVNTMVINKKIQNATAELTIGRFDSVVDILKGISDEILSVERLRFLCEFKVKNEQELTTYDGYIDNSKHYKKVLQLADEQTKATYLRLGEYCRERHDTKERIQSEIEEVNKLLEVKLYQEAIAYTKEMCKRYPQTALSWAYACEVKCTISANYNGNLEFSMMQKCPDYSETKLPKVLQNKISAFQSLSRAYCTTEQERTTVFGQIAGLMWLTAIAAGLYVLCMFLFQNNNIMILLGTIMYLGGLFAFVMTIICIVSAIKMGKEERRLRKEYDERKNLIPQSVQTQYAITNTTKKRRIFISLILAWVFAIITGLTILIIILPRL